MTQASAYQAHTITSRLKSHAAGPELRLTAMMYMSASPAMKDWQNAYNDL